MTLSHLKIFFIEYLLTLDDENRDSWYTTDRNFAETEIEKFLTWLETTHSGALS
jgi:hypothetical protein